MKLSQKLIKEQTDPFFNEWKERAHRINEMHRQRNASVLEEMKGGILLYKKLLNHCSDAKGNSLMPLNGEERLAFIASCPGTFAAFRQLDELFSEMKKVIASKRIQLKRMEE